MERFKKFCLLVAYIVIWLFFFINIGLMLWEFCQIAAVVITALYRSPDSLVQFIFHLPAVVCFLITFKALRERTLQVLSGDDSGDQNP